MSSRKASRYAEDEHYEIGDKVFLHGLKKWGLVRFFGKTLFSDGIWLGVELSEPCGKNDGSVQRTRYFRCPSMCGVFVRPVNCSTSEVSTSRPNTPEIKRRLSSRSAGLVKTPTRIMPRRGPVPHSTGKVGGRQGDRREGEWELENFKPRSHYNDFDSITNDHTYHSEPDTVKDSYSVDQAPVQGNSPSGSHKEGKGQLLDRMTDAIRSQSFDQTAASKSPPPSPLTPAFVHFSPGRDSRKEVVGGQDIHRHSYEHQKVAAWPDESAATQNSTNLAVGSSAIGTGSAGRDSTRLSSLESKVLTLLTAHETQLKASEKMENDLGSRVSQLEECVNGFGDTLASIGSTLEAVIAAKATSHEDDTHSDSSPSSIALQKEVEQLKSALAMVSGLAKQAHKATIKERQAHSAAIQSLQSRLNSHENKEPNELDE